MRKRPATAADLPHDQRRRDRAPRRVRPGKRPCACARPARVPEYNCASVATKPLVGAEPEKREARPDLYGSADIRRVRILPSTIQLRSLARRLVSIASLVAIDIGGIAFALYLALVLREL